MVSSESVVSSLLSWHGLQEARERKRGNCSPRFLSLIHLSHPYTHTHTHPYTHTHTSLYAYTHTSLYPYTHVPIRIHTRIVGTHIPKHCLFSHTRITIYSYGNSCV